MSQRPVGPTAAAQARLERDPEFRERCQQQSNVQTALLVAAVILNEAEREEQER